MNYKCSKIEIFFFIAFATFFISGCNTSTQTPSSKSEMSFLNLWERWQMETNPATKIALARQLEADPVFLTALNRALESLEKMDPGFKEARRGVETH